MAAGQPGPIGFQIVQTLSDDAYAPVGVQHNQTLEFSPTGMCLCDQQRLGTFAERYRLAPSGACLVRPDGHVAWHVAAVAAGDVERAPSSILGD